jgi:hypothetical protein
MSALVSIIAPKSVEVLCKYCFSNCKSLTSVAFEFESKLQRIEESTFPGTGLTEFLLPHSLQFLSGSAFVCCALNIVSFRPGRCEFQVHELFIEDIAGQSVVRYLGASSAVVIEPRIS